MSEILKTYTAEQLYEMYRLKVISDNIGLSDFNEGSKIRTLLENHSDIISSISMDIKEGLYKAIPIALYQGFGFGKLAADAAIGYIRPYRVPVFTVQYTGAGTVAALTSTATTMSATVTGAGADDFSFAYASYATASELVDAINALANWTATLVSVTNNPASNLLYQYSAIDILGETNYRNVSEVMDILLATATSISVVTGFSVTIDGMQILTTADATINAGESGVQIAAEFQQTGALGNIAVNAIDTLNGKGFINSNIQGITQCINDSSFSGGAAEETDANRKIRFQETITDLNAGTRTGIIAAIKAISGVRSVGIRANYPFKGTNTIVVDDGSGSISTALLASIEKVLYGDPNDLSNYPGKNAEGIGYTIVAPTIIDVSIGITAYRLPNVNVDLTTISTDIQTAVEQYINTRSLGADVLLSEIVRVGKNSNAACYDLVVSSPLINVTINENEFAKTGAGTGGTVTITMVIAVGI